MPSDTPTRTSAPDSPLLAGLTAPQREAVTHVDGPLLVLAGPGSGKTRVITSRVAYLVREMGIAPWSVLAITFTNKAAGEMRERIASMLSSREARAATISTFHSLCARLIREYAGKLELPRGYSIYDSADQQRAIKQALEDLEINPKNFTPASMLSAISNAKNELLDAEAFAKTAADFYSRTVAKVYRKYEQILTRNQALDFDDLLLKTVQLFRRHPDVLQALQERFQYVLIDEYQDTNHAQFMIASALAAGHKNICATGDPDQSIYGWRGANIQNILDFETHYPAAKVVRLEQNYRSTQRILAAADALIRNNQARKHKKLWTDNGEGDPVRVVTSYDERHEANWLVEQMREQHEQHGVQWGDMAVFYRMNSLSRVVEDAFRSAGIPYQIARGTAFYDRKEIKDAVAYLRAVANPADEVNLFRIINTPARGISDKTAKAIQAYALAHHVSAAEVLRDPMVLDVNTRAQNSVAAFSNLLGDWRQASDLDDGEGAPPLMAAAELAPEDRPGSLPGLVRRVLEESGLEAHYASDKSDPDQERLANLRELVSAAEQFEQEYVSEIQLDDQDAGRTPEPPLAEKLLAFLERISLIADVDAVDDEQGAVTLMTLHAAKGLEFSAVAVVGVEDGLLPHQRSQDTEHQLEEERRLCFVGITRAMKVLWLTHAKYRTIFGQTLPAMPSRFLSELPGEVIEKLDITDDLTESMVDEGLRQRDRASLEAEAYPPGCLVRHPQFGLGRVVKVSSVGAHTRARVEFNQAGPKTLILQYARLERVG
ncbi:MAG: ATP-dependent helicase [Phycisphaeraceae bacterium]